ncbi:uncharacterized protein Z518_07289 [Rhinocladiella mackenziei CBS 650.93]|uniref:Uncharacterized protein n=1 Tax=Rhinocladiella mackenziei CBS 650.93 TaxID=1442369 RepID=A0A0D2IKH8_9EURO|nr:uncharacterized protein Z518_07289 [Rhinocladiella mackenziei CBS 650.93]KIX03736.1 hypothetical protein Z518_07289 [Rhinocladiella mackenziei CBS 650.93]
MEICRADVKWAIANAKGYRYGAHRETDQVRDQGKYAEKTKKNHNATLERYLPWHLGRLRYDAVQCEQPIHLDPDSPLLSPPCELATLDINDKGSDLDPTDDPLLLDDTSTHIADSDSNALPVYSLASPVGFGDGRKRLQWRDSGRQ